MPHLKTNHLLRSSLLGAFILSLALLSCKKEKDDTEGIFAILWANSVLNPVCSSFTPETAQPFVERSASSYGLNSSSYTVTVPQGKQCYFKFTPSTAGIYRLNSFFGSTDNIYVADIKLHMGLINKLQTKIPSNSVDFDAENLAANLLTTRESITRLLNFYQNANSSRILMLDGSNCSECKIKLEITKSDVFNTFGCTNNSFVPSGLIRFDESGLSLRFSNHTSPCYYLFVSPTNTTAQFTQTKTYTGLQNLSMVLSVSSPITAPTTTFTSAASNTNNSAATVSGITTQAGQGRYIKTDYSYTIYDSNFSHTLSNGY